MINDKQLWIWQTVKIIRNCSLWFMALNPRTRGLVHQTQLSVGLCLQPLHDSTGCRGSSTQRWRWNVALFGCQFCYVQNPGDPWNSTLEIPAACGIWWPVVLLSDVQILGYLGPTPPIASSWFTGAPAAGIHLPPAAAAAAMACSSIMVASGLNVPCSHWMMVNYMPNYQLSPLVFFVDLTCLILGAPGQVWIWSEKDSG